MSMTNNNNLVTLGLLGIGLYLVLNKDSSASVSETPSFPSSFTIPTDRAKDLTYNDVAKIDKIATSQGLQGFSTSSGIDYRIGGARDDIIPSHSSNTNKASDFASGKVNKTTSVNSTSTSVSKVTASSIAAINAGSSAATINKANVVNYYTGQSSFIGLGVSKK